MSIVQKVKNAIYGGEGGPTSDIALLVTHAEDIEGRVTELEATVASLERTLAWYAHSDRYVPRYQGVGRVGAGDAYYAPIERDMGEFARRVLKMPEGTPSIENSRKFIAEVRAAQRVDICPECACPMTLTAPRWCRSATHRAGK